jgi:hypothetical protein
VRKAQGGEADFAAARRLAESAVQKASGAAPESEAWIDAQLMMTRLEQATASARDALASLDDERRYLDQHPGSPDREALLSAIAQVEAIDDRQSATIRELLSRLR